MLEMPPSIKPSAVTEITTAEPFVHPESGLTDADLRAAYEYGSEEMRSFLEYVATSGLERVAPDQRAAAVTLRLISFMIRCRRQPLGCENMAEAARTLGVSKNAIWQADKQVGKRMQEWLTRRHGGGVPAPTS